MGHLRVADIGSGALIALLGLGVLTQTLPLGLFRSSGAPGAGMFPSLLAASIIVLGGTLAIHGFMRTDPDSGHFAAVPVMQWIRALGVWIALMISVGLIPTVGFLLSMLVLTSALLLGIERLYSMRAIATIVALPTVSYLLFALVLGVDLPAGWLGF